MCARPVDVNGMGLSIAATDRYVRHLERIFTILPNPQGVAEIVDVVQPGVSGAKVHDAYLVATMKVHTVTRILTFNVDDFTRYRDLEVVHPQAV